MEMETRTMLETETDAGSRTETETESGTNMGMEMRWTRRETVSDSDSDSDPVLDWYSDSDWVKRRPVIQIQYYSCKAPVCKLSNPAQPHNLRHTTYFKQSRVAKIDMQAIRCFTCGTHISDNYRYHCDTCDLDFHRGCHRYTPEIRHPFHLQHPLTLTFLDNYPDFHRRGGPRSRTNSSRFDASSGEDDSDSKSDFSVMKCKCCRRNLGNVYYACSICAFTLHLSCAKFSPPLTIKHRKAHKHNLSLLPRKNPSPCDACGLSLSRQSEPVYACLPCTYMVHRRCIYLPRVIKITRHQHRIAYTPSLLPLDFSCGVCRKGVDINCGQYSCTVGCLYSVHSKCATRKDVWDGKELEGVPLEEEDIPPFTRIDDQTIHHFSHEHDLRFHGNDDHHDIRVDIKFCQACVLPIIFDPFYSCMQCSFVLHEECASRSLKIHHPLHVHPLSLVLRPPFPRPFECSACSQTSLGFLYECNEEYCVFKIDARCASVSEPFNDKSHPHPLYFTLRKGKCMGYHKDKKDSWFLKLSMGECLECISFLCLQCATLPDVAIYKHDKHPLTLCYGEKTTSGIYWCEICEEKLDAKMWFYRCQECSHTLHIHCVLGVDTNLKPGYSYTEIRWKVNILPNNGNSRPVCYKCDSRCKGPQVFKYVGESDSRCSYRCLQY